MTKKLPDNPISAIFRFLNQIRNHPHLKLEPLVAPYFTYYLPSILNGTLDKGQSFNSCRIVPEFPLRNGTLGYDSPLNGSKKADYLVLSDDRKSPYIVELKTDMSSIDPEQIDYLNRASKIKFSDLTKSVFCMAKKSNKKKKYVHLVNELGKLEMFNCKNNECVEAIEEVFSKSAFGENRCKKNWTDAMDKLDKKIVYDVPYEPTIVFIVPDAKKAKKKVCELKCHECKKEPGKRQNIQDFHAEYIDFKQIAYIIQGVEGKQDLGSIFAHYLHCWATNPAGSMRPNKE